MDSHRSLLQAAALEVIAPKDTSSELQELLAKASETSLTQSTFSLDIQRRDLLFTDERVRVVVALSVPRCEEQLLQSWLSTTNIRIEAWAHEVDPMHAPEGPAAEPVREMIYATTLPLEEEPTVVAQETDGARSAKLTLVWQVFLTLTRPRTRMMDPAVSFYAVLTSTPPANEAEEKDFLTPFEAAEHNVLGALRTRNGQSGHGAYLPASALVRINPRQPKTPRQHQIEHMTAKIRLAPAIIARMSYHKASTHDASPCIVAALNVEVIPFIDLQAEITSLTVSIENGTLEDLTRDLLPLSCRSKEFVTFLYRLQQAKVANIENAASVTSQLPNFDVLSIHLQLDIRLSETCKPQVLMDLTTNIDFFQALNQSYGGPSQPLQRSHQPPSLPLNNRGSQSQTTMDTTLQPAMSLSNFNGVTISFTAPTAPVKVGEPFIWRILVNNRSSRAAKFAIYPLPRIPRSSSHGSTSGKRHTSRISMASFKSHEKQTPRQGSNETDVAQAAVDENVVYALQHSHTLPKQTDLIALTAEVRVGSLGPTQCHESEIEFMALKSGTFQIDTIRIVDLIREAEEGINAPGVMLDIRDLPDVVVIEA